MDLVAHGFPDRPDQDSCQYQYIYINTRVVRHTQRIHKEQFEVTADLNQSLYHTVHHQGDDHERDKQGNQRTLHGRIREFLIVVNQHNGRDTQQVQQVDTDTQSHQIGNQHNPTVGMRGISHRFPFQDQPEYQGRKQRRIGIYLSFDSREPECITEGISQSTYQTGTHDRNGLAHRDLLRILNDNLFGQMGDTPEKEQDSQTTEQGRHGIHHLGYRRRIGSKLGKQIRRQHEERCSGRMPYFQFIR